MAYEDEYPGEDVGYSTTTQRMGSSVIRNRYVQPRQTGTQRPPVQPTIGRQVSRVLDDIPYNPVPLRKRGSSVIAQPQQQPQRRWETNGDPALRPLARKTSQQQQVQPPATRLPAQPKTISRRTLFGVGAGCVFVGIVGGNAVIDKLRALSLLMAQGPEPYKNLRLYCGHGEKPGSPTWLHVFIMDYHLMVIELPGENFLKSRETVLDGLPPTGDMSQWDLQVVKQQVDGGKWQIQLSVQGSGFIWHGLLVDSGQGYFRAVKPK